jgi:hypothetical protein
MAKWLFAAPALALIASAAIVPGGLVFFGLPLVWLGGVVLTRIAGQGAAETWPQPVRVRTNRRETHER